MLQIFFFLFWGLVHSMPHTSFSDKAVPRITGFFILDGQRTSAAIAAALSTTVDVIFVGDAQSAVSLRKNLKEQRGYNQNVPVVDLSKTPDYRRPDLVAINHSIGVINSTLGTERESPRLRIIIDPRFNFQEQSVGLEGALPWSLAQHLTFAIPSEERANFSAEDIARLEALLSLEVVCFVENEHRLTRLRPEDILTRLDNIMPRGMQAYPGTYFGQGRVRIRAIEVASQPTSGVRQTYALDNPIHRFLANSRFVVNYDYGRLWEVASEGTRGHLDEFFRSVKLR